MKRMTFEPRMRWQQWDDRIPLRSTPGRRMRRRPTPSRSMGMRLFMATRWAKAVRQMAQQMRP